MIGYSGVDLYYDKEKGVLEVRANRNGENVRIALFRVLEED